MNKVLEYIFQPWRMVTAFDIHVASIIPDALYIKSYYRTLNNGAILDLDHPRTYCEKLNWLKLHDKNPIYGQMTDKLEVRKYLKAKYPWMGEHLIPLLAVYNNADEIDFSSLPARFVMKCTHDSGSVIICKDKEKLNQQEVRDKLKLAINRKYWRHRRETAYSQCNSPKILIEKYIYDSEDIADQPDYKFFCFDGKVKIFQSNVGRTRLKIGVCYYDENKRPIDIIENDPHCVKAIPIELPQVVDKMIEMSEQLSNGIPQVRVDFLLNKEKIYFSEFTFYHCGGMAPFIPDRWNYILGDWIKLPIEDGKRMEQRINLE